VTYQLPHWRVASAAAVFVLAGSSAVALATHDRAGETAGAYQSWPRPSRVHRTPARQTGAARTGLRLMSQAAAACHSTAFSALLISRSWGPTGARISKADVWHRPGGQVVAQPVGGSGNAESAAGAVQPGPGVSVIISAQEFALLQSGYVLDYAGRSSADGRPAMLVAVDRPDGTLAARYWLDGQTKLPLRRQLFDDRAHKISDASFADLRLGPSALGGMPAEGALPWRQQLGRPQIMSLQAHGWPLPAQLPGGMMLSGASQTSSAAGEVIGLSYSDGLSVISVFVQRGDLPSELEGWQRIEMAGHAAYAVDPDDQAIAWSADGYVFTVIADAPAATVGEAVTALPHSGSPGFWTRLERGFRRLASWANPFH
jgi:sigma-E factor negative regulatory protein RseB